MVSSPRIPVQRAVKVSQSAGSLAVKAAAVCVRVKLLLGEYGEVPFRHVPQQNFARQRARCASGHVTLPRSACPPGEKLYCYARSDVPGKQLCRDARWYILKAACKLDRASHA